MTRSGQHHLSRAATAALLLLGVCAASPALAIDIGKPNEGYLNSAGGGLSYGENLNKDAWLWGWSVDYTRDLGDGWYINVALAWDEDTESRASGDKVTEAYSMTFAVATSITDRFIMGAGFGHGFRERERGGEWKSIRFGNDLAVGVIASYSLWERGPHDLSPSASMEYNISDNEWSVTFDFGYSYSF